MKTKLMFKGDSLLERNVVCLEDADLEKHERIVRDAKDLWRLRCSQYTNEHGDEGTCVLRAGIKVNYIAPRCSKPTSKMLIRATEVACAQGSLTWEHSEKEIETFLYGAGFPEGTLFYDCGIMD